MNKKRIIILAVLAILAAAAFVLYQRLADADKTELVLYGNVDIRTVNLSFRVGGRLSELGVDEGDAVETGQILGRLDRKPYENALAEAQANVRAQEAALALLEAGYRSEEVEQVRADLKRYETAYDYAQKFYERQRKLLASRAVSANDVDNARTGRDQAAAALQAARDKMRQYETGYRAQDIEQGRARLLQAQAALAQAELNLEDTALLCPSPGVILTRAVEPGTMLSAGGTVFAVSLTRPVWVRAYVDEINLNRAVPGAKVDLYVDGRPERPYRGSVGFVSPSAEFTPKTVQTPDLRTELVYRLRIIVEDPDDSLRQGMPVTVKFAR